MRPHQWVKNVFVLAAFAFAAFEAGGLTFPGAQDALTRTLFAFASFCLGSSSIYLINDIMDVESDRTAESLDGNVPGAPALYIEYTPSTPVVTISVPAETSSSTEGDAISFAATALDRLDDDLTASLAWDSDIDGP